MCNSTHAVSDLTLQPASPGKMAIKQKWQLAVNVWATFTRRISFCYVYAVTAI